MERLFLPDVFPAKRTSSASPQVTLERKQPADYEIVDFSKRKSEPFVPHPCPSPGLSPSDVCQVLDSANLYELQLKNAQIGLRSGKLYEQYKQETAHRIDVELSMLRKQEPAVTQEQLLVEKAKKEAAVRKHVEELGPCAEQTKKYAREELEKVRKIDPAFAKALEEYCQDSGEEKPTPIPIRTDEYERKAA